MQPSQQVICNYAALSSKTVSSKEACPIKSALAGSVAIAISSDALQTQGFVTYRIGRNVHVRSLMPDAFISEDI